MSTVSQQLTDLIAVAAVTAGHGDSPIPLEPCVPTNNPEHGDYQSNYAFRLGKSLRTNPREVAAAIVQALPANDLVGSADVAGPGFINFRLADDWLSADVQARSADSRLNGPTPGAGKNVVIDYSSPNIAKRMHVGHIRSTIIGNALHRLLVFLGYSVTADNHVGDWGTQFGKLIVGWHDWRDDAAYAEDPIAELQRIYQGFGDRAEADPSLIDRARAETAKLQKGDATNLALWEQFVEASLIEFDSVYERLGVDFDVVHGESFYRDGLQDLIDELLERGIAKHNEGAVIIEFDKSDGKGLGTPLLIRKSDGAALYGTTDLATVRHRMQTWAPSDIIYVTDLRQKLHFRQVFAACRKMGVDDVALHHVPFGMLRFPDGAVAATRGGGTVNLVDVLDTAVEKARAIVEEKSGHLPEDEKARIAEAIGVGAVKYSDLSQNPQTDITFDWEKSLALDGNSSPYMLYAYARCANILRKGEERGAVPTTLNIGHPLEREIAIGVVRTVEAIEQAARTWRPNILADHLYGLSQSLSRFYPVCRVLSDDAETTGSRLVLIQATANALKIGLDLLGLQVQPRM